jgi:hypothetical protein
MKTQLYLFVFSILLVATSCQKETKPPPPDNSGDDVIVPPDDGNNDDTNNNEWLIPKSEVRDGGPGKDGIPALTNPEFIGASQENYLSDNSLVLGFANGTDVRAYPHPILDWHEIINDDIGDKSIAIIYCPLTGTGIGWNRKINGTVTSTFGVSGLLYNSNIIPYDRTTNSNWSQILLKSVNGKLSGQKSTNYNLVETTWATWKTMYPDTKVVSSNTGYSRNYTSYPYGDYRTNDNNIIFPVSNTDNRLSKKERVLGILVDEKAKAYSINKFSTTISSFTDIFRGVNLVITGSKTQNFIVAYDREIEEGVLLDFEVVQSSLPIILQDNEGTSWDVFGRGVEGPRTGEQLKTVTQFIGYWFAWAAFYPDIKVY